MFEGNVTIADFAQRKLATSRKKEVSAQSRSGTYVGAFAKDCSISTSRGLVAVGELQLTDRIFTRDNGFQNIKFVGKRIVNDNSLTETVRILAHSIAPSVPMRDVTLSTDQYVLMTDPQHGGFNTEKLVRCQDLLQQSSNCFVQDHVEAHYVIELDRDEVILVDGMWVSTTLRVQETLAPIAVKTATALAEVYEEAAMLGARPIARLDND